MWLALALIVLWQGSSKKVESVNITLFLFLVLFQCAPKFISFEKYGCYVINNFDFCPLGIVLIVLLQDISCKSTISKLIIDFAAIYSKIMYDFFLDYQLHYIAVLWQDIFSRSKKLTRKIHLNQVHV